jgi:hypothetical protein
MTASSRRRCEERRSTFRNCRDERRRIIGLDLRSRASGNKKWGSTHPHVASPPVNERRIPSSLAPDGTTTEGGHNSQNASA